MKTSLVQATTTQLAAEADASKASKFDLLGTAAAVMAAFTALNSTDLADIGNKLMTTIKNPIIVAALIAAFVFVNIKGE